MVHTAVDRPLGEMTFYEISFLHSLARYTATFCDMSLVQGFLTLDIVRWLPECGRSMVLLGHREPICEGLVCRGPLVIELCYCYVRDPSYQETARVRAGAG